MQRTFLVGTLAALITVPALAGLPHRSLEPDPATVAATMQEHLELDDTAAEGIAAAITTMLADTEALRADLRGTAEALQAARDDESTPPAKVSKLIHRFADLKADIAVAKLALQDQIDALLTPEQAQKLRAYRKRKMQKAWALKTLHGL